MRAIVYSRVSTDAQERDGTSLDSQERACIEHVQMMGWQVVECIRDTASGYTLDRPGIERVRRLVRERQVDAEVAYAVDRLSRNQNQIGVLVDEAQSWGVRLEFVTEKFEDTAVGRFILAARAFSAEVEREKIVERTMRGKVERAKSGRIPQGTGKGCYGYTYNATTGMRELNSMQAPIVQRIFELFYSGTSCHGIAEELNREGLQALGGGRWHPLTVRRILDNDTYTGRTVYRRTQVQFTRDPHSGKKRRQVQFRDESEWIEIHGATPPIVTSDIYAKAQAILNDPYRRLARKPSGVYRLRGHIRCLSCGTPMVGHALAKGRYRYYRCRRTYSGYAQGSCDSRYISVETLEQTVLCELARVLSEPRVLLSEARRLNGDDGEAVRKTELQRKLNAVEAEQRRLARLYTAGMLPDDILEGESRRLSAQRQRLENERQVLEAKGPNMIDLERLERELPEALTRLRQWVLLATEDDMALILEALQVQIRASNDQVFIEGVIPTSIQSKQDKSVQDFVTIERTWASPRGCNLRSPRA